MARGWAVIWHKHYRGLLVFLVGTLLLTMIQIASMYLWPLIARYRNLLRISVPIVTIHSVQYGGCFC